MIFCLKLLVLKSVFIECFPLEFPSKDKSDLILFRIHLADLNIIKRDFKPHEWSQFTLIEPKRP